MKFLEEVARTGTGRVLLLSTLVTPILLTSCKLPVLNFLGSSDVLTSPQKTGVIQTLKQRKQYLEELQEGTYGLPK